MPTWVRTILVTGLPDEVRPLLEAHREQLRELNRAGKLRVAGELGREDGFVDVFDAVDRHEAEAVTRASPLIESGQASWVLREWGEISFDGE